MRTKKTKSHQGHNISELSRLVGMDRAAIRKLVVGITPIAEKDGQKFYRLEDIQTHLSQKPSKSLKDEKLSEEIRKLRLKNDRDEGKSVLKLEIAAAIRKALSGVSGLLESKLVSEWPSAVAGLDPAQARVYGRRLYDDVMAQCQALAKEFPE